MSFGGSNAAGFNALPGGYRQYSNGTFGAIGTVATFMCSDANRRVMLSTSWTDFRIED